MHKIHGRSYSKGAWFAPNQSDPESYRFIPEQCLFPEPSNINSCLQTLTSRKILITGDSNGKYYFEGLLKFLKRQRWHCSLERQESNIPSRDHEYFAVPSIPSGKYQTSYRGCAKCISKTFRCLLENDVVTVEFIRMNHYIDSSITIKHEEIGNFESRVYRADTFMTYCLTYYLKHNGYPNLWIISPPLHHDVWRLNLQHFRADMVYLSTVIDIYWPSNSTMLLPDIKECDDKVPKDVTLAFGDISNSTLNELIMAMNRIMFDVLEKKLTRPTSEMYAFLDLSQMTCPYNCTWFLDGAHMVPFWYPKIMQNVLALFCSG